MLQLHFSTCKPQHNLLILLNMLGIISLQFPYRRLQLRLTEKLTHLPAWQQSINKLHTWSEFQILLSSIGNLTEWGQLGCQGPGCKQKTQLDNGHMTFGRLTHIIILTSSSISNQMTSKQPITLLPTLPLQNPGPQFTLHIPLAVSSQEN